MIRIPLVILTLWLTLWSTPWLIFRSMSWPGLLAERELVAADASHGSVNSIAMPGLVPVSLHMLLTKTMFRIRVLTVEVFFDPRTSDQIRTLAGGQGYSDRFASQSALAALHAGDATIRLHFLRHIGFRKLISEIESAVRCPLEAGLIPETELARVRSGLPTWFAALKARDVRKGDLIEYEIRGTNVRTIYRDREGRVLLDQRDQGEEKRNGVLGSYFASCSEFREPLLRSYFPDSTGFSGKNPSL